MEVGIGLDEEGREGVECGKYEEDVECIEGVECVECVEFVEGTEDTEVLDKELIKLRLVVTLCDEEAEAYTLDNSSDVDKVVEYPANGTSLYGS